MSDTSILIPIRHSEEVVEISVNSLPDANDVVDTLSAELPPIKVWIQLALAYHSQAKHEDFELILNSILRNSHNYREENLDLSKIYYMLSSHYLFLAEKTTDEKKREEFYTKVNDWLINVNLLEGAQNEGPLNCVIKGIMCIQQQRFDRALILFDIVLQTEEKNIPALLGKACVLFHQKKYSNALQIYIQVLTIHPKAPGNVRFGIGLCYYKLGNYKKARACFERVLEIEQNVEALVGLAILDLNSSKDDRIMSAMNHLKKAYQLDPSNSVILNHLANHFFFRGDIDKVQQLSLNAFNNSSVPEIKGESCYYMARAFHYQQSFDKSFQLYLQLTQIYPDFSLGHFSLGQMYIQRDEIDKAISEFQKVATKHPENFETQKILGSLYCKKGDFETASKYLKMAHELMKKDEEILIELAQIEKKPLVSLNYYLEALKIMKERNVPIRYELINNIGALQLKLGKVEDALNNLTEALALTGSSLEDYKLEHLNIIYNISRCYESSNTEKSREIYINLVSKHPSFIEGYLRLAKLEFNENNLKKAIEWCEIAQKIRPKDSISWALCGYFYLKKKEWSKAQEMYEYIINNIDKNHTLTNLSMGHIYFSFVKPDMKEKEEKYIEFASQYFEKILHKDPSNVIAATGLGGIVSELGYIETGKEIFLQCRENTDDIPEIWINIGHISYCMKQYHQAIKMYENCLKRFYQYKNIDLLIYISRVYFEMEDFSKSKRYLEKGLMLEPSNSHLLYNLAICQHDQCVKILKEKKKNLEEANFALNEINSSRELLKTISKGTSLYSGKAKSLLENSKETQRLAKKFYEDSQLKEKQSREMEQKERELMEKTQKENEEKMREMEEKKKKDEEEKYLKALEAQRKYQLLQKEWKEKEGISNNNDQDEQEGETPKKRKKRKKAEGEEGSEKKDKKKRGRKKKKQDKGEKEEEKEGEEKIEETNEGEEEEQEEQGEEKERDAQEEALAQLFEEEEDDQDFNPEEKEEE